jgi:RNA polymerase sigma-70 factor (ECF subfamily)
MRKVSVKALDVYEVLVREHEGMLHAYLMGLMRDPALVEDIAQEAFVQAYRKLSTLKNKEAFGAWLRTIARNIALAALKRRGKEIPTDPEVLRGMEEVFSGLDDSKLGGKWEERVTLVRNCFEDLPETLRDVCTLHYFEDQLAKDIAGVLRISLAAVLKRLERARQAIRQCVEKKLGLGRA